MKFFILSTVLTLLGLQLRAEDKKTGYESWKTFQSDYGYELKYPDCWDLEIDNPDEKGPFEQIQNLAIIGKKCALLRENSKISTPVGVRAGYKSYSYDSLKDAEAKKSKLEKACNAERSNGRCPFFNRQKLDNGESIDYVEIEPDKSIRWHREVFCGQRQISVIGPEINPPNDEYINRMKAGDFALPEPQKIIYESIKCIEPKIKGVQKK